MALRISTVERVDLFARPSLIGNKYTRLSEWHVAPRIVRLARYASIPEKLTPMVDRARALTDMCARDVATNRHLTAVIRTCFAFVNVFAAGGRIWITFVTDVTVATVRTRDIETVSVLAAAVRLSGAFINITALVVCGRNPVEVPSWRWVWH